MMDDTKKSKYKLVSIYQENIACPSQFFGNLEDGRAFYIRYRWGWVSIRVTIQIVDFREYKENNFPDETVYEFQAGDEYDGVIEYDEILEILQSNPDLFDIEDMKKITNLN